MNDRLIRFWNALWFTPATRPSLVAARTIVCLQTLWLLLSRPTLWSVAEWPRAFLPLQHPTLLLRFGIFNLPPYVEHVLYIVLGAAVLCALMGFAARVACLVAGILLYHFAPLEEIITGMHMNGLGGFTLPVLALLILSFVPRSSSDSSPDYRWPVVMIQFLFSLSILLSGLSKIRFTGITWYGAHNVAETMLEMSTLAYAPWAVAAASHRWAVWAISLATLVLELSFPLALFSRRARWVLLPAAFVGHWLRTRIYGFYALGWPLLLLFIDWDWVAARLRAVLGAKPEPVVS